MPRLVSQIRREIHRINQTGVSILLVEQNVETALRLCPRVFLMEKGAVVYSGAAHGWPWDAVIGNTNFNMSSDREARIMNDRRVAAATRARYGQALEL